ncbi:hypothetical protein BHU62_11435 [Serratia marcescens]|uniref:Uncharacterized protein n=1 Tax=Serratia marcescens TaxID=615 RepID=A0A1Q4P013_SERMA|nr:hypothetical protein BHU62_11435 [Serratia marcescens]
MADKLRLLTLFPMMSFSTRLSEIVAAAHIFGGTSGFNKLQNGDDRVLFTYGDLLRGHNQYVGRSLKIYGPFKWNTS